jgi:hypothetical protein
LRAKAIFVNILMFAWGGLVTAILTGHTTLAIAFTSLALGLVLGWIIRDSKPNPKSHPSNPVQRD